MENINKKQYTLIQIWRKIKQMHQDSIVLVKLGDFYETCNEDVIECQKILNVFSPNHDRFGFPCHLLSETLALLIRSGHRVLLYEHNNKENEK